MPADDLRDRYAEAATQWALMYPLANWPWLGRRVGEDEHLDAIAKDLAAAWGADIADRMRAVRDDEVERWRDVVAAAQRRADRLLAERDAAHAAIAEAQTRVRLHLSEVEGCERAGGAPGLVRAANLREILAALDAPSGADSPESEETTDG